LLQFLYLRLVEAGDLWLAAGCFQSFLEFLVTCGMTATLELEILQNCRNNGGSGFFIAESSAASSKT